MSILCLGDSIVYGYGVPRAQAWSTLVQKQTDRVLRNEGVPGDTTGGMLARLPLLLHREQKPDALFLFGGTNDFFAGCSASVPSANMMAMGQQALSRGIPVIFSVPTPIIDPLLSERWLPIAQFRSSDVELRRYRDFLNTLSNGFPKGMSTVFDFCTPFASHKDPAELFSDGIHLTAAGQALFCSVFIDGIDRFLS